MYPTKKLDVYVYVAFYVYCVLPTDYYHNKLHNKMAMYNVCIPYILHMCGM